MKAAKLIQILILFTAFMALHAAFALPEDGLKTTFGSTILPFLATGKTFHFTTTDGMSLSAVKFENPDSTKTIVVVNGRSETWLKYGEVFYDLYNQGYTIYSYDQRGQGLSPHLSNVSSEIGHVEHFHSYIEDLNTFVTDVVVPERKAGDTLFLLSHSLGGAVAGGYLAEYTVPFKKAILSSPMLQVNTAPYPEVVARGIVDAYILFGRGQHYAIGMHDYDVTLPVSKSTTTSSENRWWMTNQVYSDFPATLLGGPSNRWVLESLKMSHSVKNEMGYIKTPFLMFQAESDQIVKLAGENTGCAKAGELCTMMEFPNSQHEIMFERDVIRDQAMTTIMTYFQ